MDLIFFGILFVLSFAFFAVGKIFQNNAFLFFGSCLFIALGWLVFSSGVSYDRPLTTTISGGNVSYGITIYNLTEELHAPPSAPAEWFQALGTANATIANTTETQAYQTVSSDADFNRLLGLILMFAGLYGILALAIDYNEAKKQAARDSGLW